VPVCYALHRSTGITEEAEPTLSGLGAQPTCLLNQQRGWQMRKARCGWTMPEEDARSMLRLIEERIRSSSIDVQHRDVLIRLRAIIERISAT
jgi:hypothetical protein